MTSLPTLALSRRPVAHLRGIAACGCILGMLAVEMLAVRPASAEPAAPKYGDYRAFTERLDRDVARAGSLARKVSLARTRGGRR